MKVNFDRLKKVAELGHCLCDLKKSCPCDDFLKTKQCKCGVYEQEE